MNDKKYGLATTYSDGLMSAADKAKVNSIPVGGVGDMLKSTYDTNNDGVVDKSDAVKLQGNQNTIRFGIDGNGNYGYYKVGADTVTPFRGAESETVLWSNPNGATMDNVSSFDAQQITLSSAASNFDRLRVYYKSVSNPGTGTAVMGICDTSLDSISRMVSGNWNLAITIGAYYASAYPYARGMYFTDTTYTKLYVCSCYGLNATSNGRCIPLKICGITV